MLMLLRSPCACALTAIERLVLVLVLMVLLLARGWPSSTAVTGAQHDDGLSRRVLLHLRVRPPLLLLLRLLRADEHVCWFRCGSVRLR